MYYELVNILLEAVTQSHLTPSKGILKSKNASFLFFQILSLVALRTFLLSPFQALRNIVFALLENVLFTRFYAIFINFYSVEGSNLLSVNETQHIKLYLLLKLKIKRYLRLAAMPRLPPPLPPPTLIFGFNKQ